MTREQELKSALRKSNLPPGPHKVYYYLLHNRADWVTGRIPDARQPKSIADFAAAVDMAPSTLRRQLKFLSDLDWIERTGGRGTPTRYQVKIGVPVPKSRSMTGSERTRRYRERQKLRSKLRHSDATNRHIVAGQEPVVLKGIRTEGEVTGDGWICSHADADGHCSCWHDMAVALLDRER